MKLQILIILILQFPLEIIPIKFILIIFIEK